MITNIMNYTLLDFLQECLIKNGHYVERFKCNDKSSSGVEIRRKVNGKDKSIHLQFNGNGTELQDIQVFENITQKVDEKRIA